MPSLNYLILLKILEKQQDLFGIIIQINQILHILFLVIHLIMKKKEDKDLDQFINQKVFDYKTKFINALPAIDDDVTTESEEIKTVVPLKNLSNFIFSLNFLMINTEIDLILKWSQNCVLTHKVTRPHSDQVLNQNG